MTNVPKLSVVISTYNRGTVVSRVLRRLIAQTKPDWEAFAVGVIEQRV